MADLQLETKAREIGRTWGAVDAREMREGRKRAGEDELHHPGDDTGRLMWEAYEADGASAAVDVLDAYVTAYNHQRELAGQPAIPHETIRDNFVWAVSMRDDRDAQRAMRDEYAARHQV